MSEYTPGRCAMRLSSVPRAKQMRRHGFTDRREGFWYFCKRVGSDTTFNLTINKETGDYEHVVMNESFGQPEYYMSMRDVYRDQIKANVNVILYELERDLGLRVEFNHDEYGGVR